MWIYDKLDELQKKGRKNWTEDDWEAYNYCLNTLAEIDAQE